MSAIVLVVIKASVILAAALAVVTLAGGARAAVRHLVLAVTFGALLLLPAAVWMLPARPLRMRPAQLASVVLAARETTVAVAARAGRAVESRPVARPWPRLPLAPLLEWTWLAGACMALLPLLGGLRELRRIRREADACHMAGVSDPVRALMHHGVPGPMTFGVWRPVIVFPVDARDWDTVDLQRALRHELEHVRRRDCLVDAIARLTCALYWFHPLVWISWHRLRLEAERACDDAVLLGGDAVGYAEQLVSLATRLTTPAPLLAMAGSRDLTRRIAAVLDREQRRGRAGRRWMTGAAVAALLVVALVAPLSAGSEIQTRQTPVAFEVASIKENHSGDPQGGGDEMLMRIDPGGRLTVRNATMQSLILLAYRFEITRNQLGPLEGWMERQRFDIDARAADGAVTAIDRNSAQTMDRMLQALLADRFKLRVRRESKTGEVYVLSIADRGLRLKPSDNADACAAGVPLPPHGSDPQDASPPRLKPRADGFVPCHMFTRFGRRGFDAVAVDTWDLAQVLREIVHAPVEDRARVATLFDASVHWNADSITGPARDLPAGAEPQPTDDDPDVPTALREQLGLKLDRQRGPVETLVVEHAELPAVN
jgi:uncharacterized protein (TIGR03435 family)